MENKIKGILFKHLDETLDENTAAVYSNDFTRIARDIVKLYNLHFIMESALDAFDRGYTAGQRSVKSGLNA